MTFSIVGRCAETGQLGIAISSSSIAVGARCPWVRSAVGAVATQNVTLPALGQRVLDLLLHQQLDAQQALRQALATDNWNSFRQVTVVDAMGRTAFFSGKQSLGIHDCVVGRQCVAAGNLLANKTVVAAMAMAFEGGAGMLADRLVLALRAGQAQGGEAGQVHSAALKVAGDESWPMIDLRVDWADEQPIEELAVLWRAYHPQMQDYLIRALDPTAAPSYGVPGDA